MAVSQFNCFVCGKQSRGKERGQLRRFCSRPCFFVGRSPKGLEQQVECSCFACGATFRSKVVKGAARRFCSHLCRSKTWQAEFPEKAEQAREKSRAIGRKCAVYFPACVVCGDVFTARWPTSVACGPACKAAKLKSDTLARDMAISARPRKCAGCGCQYAKPYGKAGGKRYCSLSCQGKTERKRRGGHGPKRAKLKGAEYRYFSVTRIFERDGWTCQLCGKPTPRKLRGTYEPNAPEIDHIIPISAGGSHTQENVQCACRSCNAAKGARPMGQMWLAGMADTIVRA